MRRDGPGEIGRAEAERDLRDLEAERAEVDDDRAPIGPVSRATAMRRRSAVPRAASRASTTRRRDGVRSGGGGDVDAHVVAALASSRDVGRGAEREEIGARRARSTRGAASGSRRASRSASNGRRALRSSDGSSKRVFDVMFDVRCDALALAPAAQEVVLDAE